jgi:hypothetical protein
LLRLAAARDNAAMQTEPPNADPPNRRRRWHQFSLRSLLLAVTAFGVWLGWESHAVRDRKAVIEEIRRTGGAADSVAYLCEIFERFQHPRPKEASATIPFFRAWFGDEPIAIIRVAIDAPPGEEKRIAILFPEAKVKRMRIGDVLTSRGYEPLPYVRGTQ